MEAVALRGQTLGRYLVEDLIGMGGMGVVYRALDVRDRRKVALKVVASRAGHESDLAARLKAEARWLACCRAPHVVRVFETASADGVDFIAMELMATTLEALIAGNGPLGDADLLGIGTQMLLGLESAHLDGVLHGDVKPANVGVSSDGIVKLLDFGVARPLPGCTHGHSATTGCLSRGEFGTIQYMSPEQLRGDPLDVRADVYSAGAVLYEAATGRPPFAQQGLVCLIDAVLHVEPKRPRELNPALSPGFDELVMTALAKDASARFGSTRDMRAALLRSLPSVTDRSRRAPRVEASRPARVTAGRVPLASERRYHQSVLQP
jgi:eukaryotic-like serine/threonine-protein kinase